MYEKKVLLVKMVWSFNSRIYERKYICSYVNSSWCWYSCTTIHFCLMWSCGWYNFPFSWIIYILLDNDLATSCSELDQKRQLCSCCGHNFRKMCCNFSAHSFHFTMLRSCCFIFHCVNYLYA